VRTRATAKIESLKEQLEAENVYLREEIRLANTFDDIVGEDNGLQQCLLAVEKVAATNIPVLIQGETGTGKELIARSVHRLSPRHDEPMVCVNCPALQADLIESELFGHEKGAFTGAHSQRRGRFELASNGTLFLDEIGDIPLDLQAKLLRVLQTGDYQRIGGSETLHSNVRLIAATNRDLKREADQGKFRADLYYRINTFPIRLPPLRDRKDDIPLLAEHFVHKHARRLGKTINAISVKMIRDLMEYAWPGNVRELEGTIVRALISSTGSSSLELPFSLQRVNKVPETKPELRPKRHDDLSTFERSHIVDALDRAGGKIGGKRGAAAMLGMPASTLRSKMSRLGIKRRTT
jgi:transcriptional regulator with GAF, ATPase, and Fis domain